MLHLCSISLRKVHSVLHIMEQGSRKAFMLHYMGHPDKLYIVVLIIYAYSIFNADTASIIFCVCVSQWHSLVFHSVWYCNLWAYLNECVSSYLRECVSQCVSARLFQVTPSGCQIRSCLYPPGTWSESPSASVSPSASKVQTWQLRVWVHSAALSQNHRIKATIADNRYHLVDERALQISLDAFAVWAAMYQDLPAESHHMREH